MSRGPGASVPSQPEVQAPHPGVATGQRGHPARRRRLGRVAGARQAVAARAARLPRWWPWPAGVVLALVTWPVATIAPSADLDGSWRIALHLAARERVEFGTDLVFTYGPLGFLAEPVLVTLRTAGLALLAAAAVQVALCVTLLAGARRSMPGWAALVATFVVASILLPGAEVVTLLAFLWIVLAYDGAPPVVSRLAVPAMGVLAAALPLVKLNAGVGALPLLAVLAWRLPPAGWRSLAAFAGSAAAALLALWVVTGGSLGALLRWLLLSAEVVTGYAEAMAYEQPGREWEYLAAGVLLGGLALLLWWQTLTARPVARAAVLGSAAFFAFVLFKHGFVRHDGHSQVLFGSLAAASLVIPWRAPLRRAGVAASAFAVVVVLGGPEVGIRHAFAPLRSAGAAMEQFVSVADVQGAAARVEDHRATLLERLELDADTLRAVRGWTTHVDPYAAVAAWAADVDWRPLPVFQSYAAWTPRLEELNVEALESPAAPQRVLRQRVERLHGATAELESRAVLLTLVCRYREVHATQQWQVLAAAPDRCAPPRSLGAVEAQEGEPVLVPPPPADDHVVYARFRLPSDPARALRGLLHKPTPSAEILLDEQRRGRLVRTTAHRPHVLRVPPAAGFSPGFAGDVQHDVLRVYDAGASFRVEFFSVALEDGA